MPYQILKKGKEYILKSPTRQYKHKTLAKAKAQKRLLEEKEAKVVQKVSQKQSVTVIVNAPKRRSGQARKRTIPQQDSIIQMRPVVPTNPMEAYYANARPRQTSLLQPQPQQLPQALATPVPVSIAQDVRAKDDYFAQFSGILDRERELAKRDSFLDERIFSPQIPIKKEPSQSIDEDRMRSGEPLTDVGELFRELPQPIQESYVPPSLVAPTPESASGQMREQLDRRRRIATYTLSELRKVASDSGLKGISNLRKEGLVSYLEKNLPDYNPPAKR
jgi:hypothetical protein